MEDINHKIVKILNEILECMQDSSLSTQKWLSVQQLSKYIHLSVNTIYQYVSENKIPYYKIPGSSKILFNREEIDAWIKGELSDECKKAKEVSDEIWGQIK